MWYWFTKPSEELTGDLVNVFSYDDVDIRGFKKKAGMTTVVDLSPSIDALFAGTRKRFVQEQVRKGERNGITVRFPDDWRTLVPLYKQFRADKQLVQDDPRVLAECLTIGAYHDGVLIAGGAFVVDATNARALVLASKRFTDDGHIRELIGQANRMVIWEAMRYCKGIGVTTFDLGGIHPESTDPGERGLTEFKEAFGGKRVMGYYYTKVNSPLLRLWLRVRRHR